MDQIAFTFPSPLWLLIVPVISSVIVWKMLRQIPAVILLGCAASFAAWFGYGLLLHSEMEKWLSGQRVYEILFNDFPQDKEHYISDFLEGFQNGGEEGVAKKQEEEKIIMMVHHVKHYVESTPTEVLKNHIMAEAQMLAALSQKDQGLCQNYLGYSGYFNEVWNTVGDQIFLESVRYNPQMIVEATDHPEPLSANDRSRAYALYTELLRLMKAANLDLHTSKSGVLPCNTVYWEFYTLTRMPPQDAALIIKLLYSEDHLKGYGSHDFLRGLVPFL